MTPPELTQRLDQHDERLTAVEGRLDTTEGAVDRISRDIIAIRAEGQARAAAQTEGLDRLGRQIQGLIVQLAEQTGAQKEQTKLAEEQMRQQKASGEASLRRWKKLGIVFGLLAGLTGAALSDQEIASTIWGKWLHKQEPWDIGVTINGGSNDRAH